MDFHFLITQENLFVSIYTKVKLLEFSILYFPFTRPSACKLLIYQIKNRFHADFIYRDIWAARNWRQLKCSIFCLLLWYRSFHSRFNAIFFLSTKYKRLLTHIRNSSSNVSIVKATLRSGTWPLVRSIVLISRCIKASNCTEMITSEISTSCQASSIDIYIYIGDGIAEQWLRFLHNNVEFHFLGIYFL